MDPKTYGLVVGVVLIAAYYVALWAWAKVKAWRTAPAHVSPAQVDAAALHAAIGAYWRLMHHVDDATRAVLHEKVWPALGRPAPQSANRVPQPTDHAQ